MTLKNMEKVYLMLNKLRMLFGGRDAEGYDRFGYNEKGIDRQGYDRRGFNRKGIHKVTGTRFDESGYNKEGFDADGEHMDYAELKGRRHQLLEDGILRLDLHGMNVKAAVSLIETTLDEHIEIKRLILIHGHVHGNSLRNIVSTFEHPRIDNIITELYNQGMTIFELK